MSKLTIEDIDVEGKRVLVRVDFNVPIAGGSVVDSRRLRAAVPTISYLLERGGRLVLISHLGRPNGRRIDGLSLKPCAKVLSDLLAKEVVFIDDCVGSKVEKVVRDLANGQVVLLENLRFYREEIQNNRVFAHKLSQLADLYVNDAFGTVHRAHASTDGVTHFIDCCAMGFLVRKELSYFSTMIDKSTRLFVAVLGGSKISDKIGAIYNLIPKVDRLILGGGMVYTFLKANGFEIGESLFEPEKISFAEKLLEEYKDKILLPSDCLVTDFFDSETMSIGKTKYVNIDSIEPGWFGIDIGKKTILNFSDVLSSAKTVLWNGPVGVFEIEEAAVGTFSIAKVIGKVTQNDTVTIIGGGDSALAAEKAGVASKVSHVSTGGGASLRVISGGVLPGVAALTDCL